MDRLISMLRAAGDPARLRLLLILREAELAVSELIQIIGQSQPRVSRHLKLLCEAGLIERFKEGSWVFYRAADRGAPAEFGAALNGLADPQSRERDRARLAAIREARAAEAAAYFKANAAEWERIRALHAPEKDVETAIVRLMGDAPIENLLDAGTGTGRMLELLNARIKRGVGVDASPDMLAIARDRLTRSGAQHCQVRLADTYRLPFADGGALAGFDAVLFHQVLHYLDDPQAAVIEAARVMKAGGRLVIADFAQHDLEFLRKDYAHRRLGFSDAEVKGWFETAKLHTLAGEAIAPHKHGNEKLTVKIWMAQAPRARATVAA
ncbi:MAG TPA: metalloregulator ArsR/SmtB family transcription factor [Rhizomicrobium sp.]|jgi:ubiquinone/menaquinone biosynthesis C-methylase UbiE|nr:metalloregulator ArsR/SmtB family transcription factor [Rhizomicrobium sp.]